MKKAHCFDEISSLKENLPPVEKVEEQPLGRHDCDAQDQDAIDSGVARQTSGEDIGDVLEIEKLLEQINRERV